MFIESIPMVCWLRFAFVEVIDSTHWICEVGQCQGPIRGDMGPAGALIQLMLRMSHVLLTAEVISKQRSEHNWLKNVEKPHLMEEERM
jgi:hypothetical protein